MTVAKFLIQIALAPFLHVYGEHIGIDESAAERRVLFGMARLISEPLHQVSNAFRDNVCAGWIDIGE